jgi:hypothetical protein
MMPVIGSCEPTILEIAAALCAEQGFIVIGSRSSYQVGDIITAWNDCSETSQTPLRVISEAGEAEFIRQEQLWWRMFPSDLRAPVHLAPRYYRVIAAD